MKLYDTTMAPNPRRVRIYLAEKGIEVPMEQVDLGNMAHKSDAFVKLNPLMRVPVLELDDGTCISESMAICRYFEETQPEPPLFGRDPKEKALVEMWNRRVELNVYNAVAAAFRHGNPGMAEREEQVAGWAEVNQRRAPEMFDFLDASLGDSKYFVGDYFSIADISALITVDFARVIKLRIGEQHKNLARWHADVSGRPSAKA
ncbi:MAG: glutathione S-transferase family protein [Alphaproteobacteria bacterium]